MSYIKIHQEMIHDRDAAKALCPFGAISENASGELEIGAGCRMCRLCLRKGGGAFEFVDDSAPGVDKSKWRGVAVVAEVAPDGRPQGDSTMVTPRFSRSRTTDSLWTRS